MKMRIKEKETTVNDTHRFFGKSIERKTTTTCDYIKDKQHILYTICVILYKFPKHDIHILYTMYRCIMYTYIYN